MTHKEAYFLAKRQMTEALDYRLSIYQEELKKAEDTSNVDLHRIMQARIQELEEYRDYVRNGMLWKNE